MESLEISSNELYAIVRKYKDYPWDVYGFDNGKIILCPTTDGAFRTVTLKELLLELEAELKSPSEE